MNGYSNFRGSRWLQKCWKSHVNWVQRIHLLIYWKFSPQKSNENLKSHFCIFFFNFPRLPRIIGLMKKWWTLLLSLLTIRNRKWSVFQVLTVEGVFCVKHRISAWFVQEKKRFLIIWTCVNHEKQLSYKILTKVIVQLMLLLSIKSQLRSD